ncbi:hypothetical protein AV530_004070 [Patagioenas fasciata monilis]|uniref:Uncharacterized protein n=1 Tax=Patagioenas fasciata monilis TaxID=372326 RepID=A0A1V4L0P7_PATFA|nr:hypothetical protein AV530_004070 [Patagioenas fasciata monilis]
MGTSGGVRQSSRSRPTRVGAVSVGILLLVVCFWGSPPSCAALIALLALLTVLSGVLLWLILTRTCVDRVRWRSGDPNASVTPFQPPGAIYVPIKGEATEDGDTEMTQLVKEEDAAP